MPVEGLEPIKAKLQMIPEDFAQLCLCGNGADKENQYQQKSMDPQ